MASLIGRCNGLQSTAQQCLDARFQPSCHSRIGQDLDQILAALGAGNGANGRDGYSLFNGEVGLYGPVWNWQGEGRTDGGDRAEYKRGAATLTAARRCGLAGTEAKGRVHLQRDANFRLSLSELVGEYFASLERLNRRRIDEYMSDSERKEAGRTHQLYTSH